MVKLRPSTCRDSLWLAVLGPVSAGAYSVWTGTWLLWVPAEEVDERWPAIAGATVVGFLGIAAKVSTAAHPRNAGGEHVICVYTADCQDHADVARVLAMLRDLGYSGRLSYKEDGMTYAGRYGRGAALYIAQAESIDFDQRRQALPVPAEHLSSGMAAALAARTAGR
jgi:Domain of unknown function (DUF1917)